MYPPFRGYTDASSVVKIAAGADVRTVKWKSKVLWVGLIKSPDYSAGFAVYIAFSIIINQGESMATKAKFAVGDIVKLKSGGPEMTVQSLASSGDDCYYCQWFAGKKLEQGRFPKDSIELVQPTNK